LIKNCSFSDPEDPELGSFFEKFGFVVIDNVLSSEDCSETIDEFWRYDYARYNILFRAETHE
jgi:hypothetical protein